MIDIQADDVLLDGIIITNGYELDGHGAGLRVDGYQGLTLLNCSIVNNTVALNGGRGGGVYFNSAGTVVVSNCVIQGKPRHITGLRFRLPQR